MDRDRRCARTISDDGFLAVRVEVYVNGQLLGADLVSNMGWTFPELVAYASRNSVVVAGTYSARAPSAIAAVRANIETWDVMCRHWSLATS